MNAKKDYLSVCNDKNVREADFTLSFCNRCSQPECSRSLHGGSAFDRRVNTWTERLFTDVPKLDPKDPRYLPIVSAEFKTLDSAKTTVAFDGPAWFDPRDVPNEPVSPVTASVEELKVVVLPLEEKVEPEPVALPPAFAKNLPRALLLLNTEPQPMMLPGAPASASTGDKWSGPVPKGEPLPSAPVVKKGATIKFGGSGVE